MNRVFKSLTNRKQVDLIPYIQKYLLEHTETEIFIGCDSQNHGRVTSYATVIVLHNKGRGGHVLYSTEETPRTKMGKQTPKTEVEFTRLWAEVEKSIETAEFLKANNVKKPAFIDIDLNPDPKFKSNQALRAALGYVESLGYVVRCKPDAVSATYVADKLCK
jgi:predicted RNase H-related nuclease YkuK (DUF458 family)